VTTALVLGAGGMFAAWEVGAWSVLREHVQFDLVIGASAGAWVGWRVAAGASPEELVREWLDPRLASVMRPGLHRWGWLRPEGLHEKARELFASARPRIPFAFTITEIPSFTVRVVREDEIGPEHLAAACAIPLSFPPVEIDGHLYVDGGLMGALPLWVAEQMGADRAIGLNCLTLWPFRMVRKIVRPRRASAALDAVVIEPSRPLGSLKDSVFWNATNVERWIALGAEDAKQALSSVRM
jgi:NTE family protein